MRDIHTIKAMKIFNCKEEEVTPAMRAEAKNRNFVECYGGRFKPSSKAQWKAMSKDSGGFQIYNIDFSEMEARILSFNQREENYDKLMEALELANNIIDYVGMDSWERECLKPDIDRFNEIYEEVKK